MKWSHLPSIATCFNPRCLSENSKRCSKPFHHGGTNHMLPFILCRFPLLFSPGDKSNSGTLNCPGLLCITSSSLFSPRPPDICYLWLSSLLWMPCRTLTTASQFSSVFYKHGDASVQRNQRVCTCSGSDTVTKTNCGFINCLCVRVGRGTLGICYCGSFTTFPPSRRKWCKANANFF